MAAFVLGLLLGGAVVSYTTGEGGVEPRQVTTDAFGRTSADPHYGHNHP